MQDKTIYDKEARTMLSRIKRMIKHYNIIKEKQEKEGLKDEQSRFIQKTRKGGGYFDA